MWRPPRTSPESNPLIAGGIVVGMLLVYLADLMTPRGIAIWVGYLVFVTMSYWLPSVRAPLVVGGVGAVLTVVGAYLSRAGAPTEVVITNRTLGVTALLLTSALVWSAKHRHEENVRLKDVDRLKTEFISAFSHQIRTPLTAISGYVANMLEQGIGPLTATQQDYLHRAAHNVDRIARLTNDLLDLATIEAGNVHLAPDVIPVDALLGDVIEGLRAAANEKHIALELRLTPPLPHLHGDREKLLHALWNIGSNAIKFSPPDGRVVVSAFAIDSEVRICIADSGPGLFEDDLDKIFTPFYRSRHTAHEQGSGLGLPIAKRLIDLHGGRIWAESWPNQGATFWVQLPTP